MASFNIKDLDVPQNILSAALKGGFNSPGKILEASVREIMMKTGMRESDVKHIVNAVIRMYSPPFSTVWELENKEVKCIKFGCHTLDNVLDGGIPCGVVTEIAGESSSGKTQMSLLLALRAQFPFEEGGIAKCVAYLCTETQFPVTRLNQLISCMTDKKPFNGKQFSDNIFVHHLPDMDNLVDCVRYQLSNFIINNNIGLVIIDSVAAVFRADENRQEIKSKMVQQLGYLLRQLSSKHNIVVIAVNQVSASMKESLYGLSDNVVPSLGLSWANLVTTRLMLRKSPYCLPVSEPIKQNDDTKDQPLELRVRTLEIVFCPWLSRRNCAFVITQRGIEDAQPHSKDLFLAD